jgi:nickel-dependent lactate racemase
MYRDLWTAGKCVYKVEPIVADGGRVIVYAPHIRDLSPTHGMVIRSIGYHTRDYFLNEWERFRKLPRAVLAHSSHVRGIGTCVNGVEHDRMDVMLASAIPERECREVNLSYLDPAVIGVQDYLSRATDDTLMVPEAGEVLYRLADGSVPDVDQL